MNVTDASSSELLPLAAADLLNAEDFSVIVLKFNSIKVFQNENNRSYSEIFAPSQETSKVFMRPFPLYK